MPMVILQGHRMWPRASLPAVRSMGCPAASKSVNSCRHNLEYFARFVREHRSELATILWKDTSPQHFGWENGHFW